jgi:hypothetical protein
MPVTDMPNAIVELLTSRQHLRPHSSVGQVLAQATTELGCCPIAVARATTWLNLDVTRAIGRLRRSELLQLARAISRFWQSQSAVDIESAK